ncbi:1-acyl-sn-glycerol-3-phosphate acyltransferase [Tabrizicola sp. J26]|uniref:1-acyl-sn-glycerol-3-phosphate acyltransferase n=1 Tax=Alitabrizicola rongguiensis TaxID=2909234 RepID=UPI001F390C7A|nr:1-acyl-sn-glycerol-3-phosphate acyltransferase [Tabrizicola rongguiensis]MCF1709176.1 1-acyl-sn-glycerol-3-phosphate acyltransferase [Tabrizicola rongguiensis]
MFSTVELPLWLFVLIVAFAAVAFLSHFLFPSVRWFFRRRMERAVARLNARLVRPISPFKFMRRQDVVVRLAYDPKVMAAVVEEATETGKPENVVFDEARSYAREIAPAFSATLYFGFATSAARWLSQLFYRVKVGKVDDAIAEIDPRATVVFVMNHRSNMDYVLVTWLVADRSAISYAVGEWARIWPLSALIRSTGAYFIRRNSRNHLYRQVLARYVQMATAEGTTQAIFPEGGLSLDGRVGAAKLGLLSYMVQGFEHEPSRDVVFVPVGLAYDRVLEDRLLTEAHQTGIRRFRARPLAILGFIWRMIWRKLTGRFPGFGTATVAFGAPLSLREFVGDRTEGLSFERVTVGLGVRLMEEVQKSVPVLPVPLVAAAIGTSPVPRAELPGRVADIVERLEAAGQPLELPEGGALGAIVEGLGALIQRDMILELENALCPAPGKEALLAYYASPILQMLERVAATPQT